MKIFFGDVCRMFSACAKVSTHRNRIRFSDPANMAISRDVAGLISQYRPIPAECRFSKRQSRAQEFLRSSSDDPYLKQYA